jgi:hypothetical protein
MYTFREEATSSHLLETESTVTYGAIGDTFEDEIPLVARKPLAPGQPKHISTWEHLLHQITAVAVICLLNMMISIPFGVSYFPVGWGAGDDVESDGGSSDTDDVHGIFPFANKQALGIRMFLFATLSGQFAFTFASKFTNPVGLQVSLVA